MRARPDSGPSRHGHGDCSIEFHDGRRLGSQQDVVKGQRLAQSVVAALGAAACTPAMAACKGRDRTCATTAHVPRGRGPRKFVRDSTRRGLVPRAESTRPTVKFAPRGAHRGEASGKQSEWPRVQGAICQEASEADGFGGKVVPRDGIAGGAE